MFTRQDYMDGAVTFEQYYTSIAEAAGISMAGSELMPDVKAALAAGDEHLNTIPIETWDRIAAPRTWLATAFKAHGDFYSLAGGVCVYKQAAKNAA